MDLLHPNLSRQQLQARANLLSQVIYCALAISCFSVSSYYMVARPGYFSKIALLLPGSIILSFLVLQRKTGHLLSLGVVGSSAVLPLFGACLRSFMNVLIDVMRSITEATDGPNHVACSFMETIQSFRDSWLWEDICLGLRTITDFLLIVGFIYGGLLATYWGLFLVLAAIEVRKTTTTTTDPPPSEEAALPVPDALAAATTPSAFNRSRRGSMQSDQGDRLKTEVRCPR
jgi:hypothetical protein